MAIPAYYITPEETRKWVFNFMGFPLSIVPFLLCSIGIGYFVYRLLWMSRDDIITLFSRIGRKRSKAPEFKCNFSKDIVSHILVEAANDFFNSIEENPAESNQSKMGKAFEQQIWGDVNNLLEVVNRCLVSLERKDNYYKLPETHNELTTRMLELEEILEDTPEPDPFSEQSIQAWQSFLAITKAKMKKGELKLRDRSG